MLNSAKPFAFGGYMSATSLRAIAFIVLIALIVVVSFGSFGGAA